MSNSVKLAAKMPASEDFNGLDDEASKLLDAPETLRVAVVIYDVVKVVENTDDDTRVPYARIRRWEPLGPISEAPSVVRETVDNASEKRTGKQPLPLEDVEGDHGDVTDL